MLNPAYAKISILKEIHYPKTTFSYSQECQNIILFYFFLIEYENVLKAFRN